ncbi:MAG: alpha/beta hydrolase family protein, partial [Candidatus Caldatribacteriaceae bacterium]
EIDGGNIFLLGHSLGGYLAPEIALRDGQLRGIILCAAPARPLHQLIPEQAEYLFSLDGHVDPEEAQKLESITSVIQALDNQTLPPSTTIPPS